MLEAIALCDELTGTSLQWRYDESNRIGDHIWWISDIGKFEEHYPDWRLTYSVRDILNQIVDQDAHRWTR
jgi:CDP-paratose 2-epimerase